MFARFFTLMNEKLSSLQNGYGIGYLQHVVFLNIGQEPNLHLPATKAKVTAAYAKIFPADGQNDSINAFTQKGLTATQIDAQNYMKLLQNWRKTSEAVKFGTMKQYIPENGVYVISAPKTKNRL